MIHLLINIQHSLGLYVINRHEFHFHSNSITLFTYHDHTTKTLTISDGKSDT